MEENKLIIEYNNEAMEVFFEIVTPEKATEYLKLNHPNNRPLNKGRVAFLSNEMLKGKWHLNGDTICFSEEGYLIDGQTRLNACIHSGIAVGMLVVRCLSKEAMSTIDIGAARTMGNYFSIRGHKNAQTVSSMVNKYLKYKNQPILSSSTLTAVDAYSYSTNKVSNDEADAEYGKNPEFWQNMANYVDRIKKKKKMMSPSELGAVFGLLYLERGYDFAKVEDFFNQLTDPEKTRDKVMFLLRERLLVADEPGKGISPKHRTQLIRKAWDYYKVGNTNVRCLKWGDNEKALPFT